MEEYIQKLNNNSLHIADILALKKIANDLQLINDSLIKQHNINIFTKNNKDISQQYIEGLGIVCIECENFDNIQQTPMYFNKKTNEFGFKINNMLFSGNVGNIYTKNNKKICEKVVKCSNKNCKRKKCKYIHDGDVSNFMWYNWLFDNTAISNKNVRHIGSRDTLKLDINYVSDDEKKNLIKQNMHDILVSLLINSN